MVVDAGGRGQAIARKLANEGLEVTVSPGNPGNEDFAHSTGVDIADITGQLEAAKRYDADLTIVGPEDALNRNITWAWHTSSFFSEDRKRAIFAPYAKQAWVESDRGFAKKFAQVRGLPIGGYTEFTDKDEAMREVAGLDIEDERFWPLFVKDNGLHQGKGVTICETPDEVEAAIATLDHFVIETNVPGPELSHHAFCDGKTQLSIPFVVRDHKQLIINGVTRMTGGMGVIGPLAEYSPEEVVALGETFAAPVAEGLGFKGMLFSGLKGSKGDEKLLEWNARFGDPETQVFMRLMKSDLLPLIMACVEGNLGDLSPPQWEVGKYAACLVLAAPSYPSDARRGLLIEGLDEAAQVDGVEVLQAATIKKSNRLYTDGGRVINVVTSTDSIETAVDRAYRAAEKIRFNGELPVMRPDISATT